VVRDGSHKEREFHDEWAEGINPDDVVVDDSWHGAGVPECGWILRQLGDLTGLRILELGTGAGEGAVYFAKRGAKVTATDISPGMLNLAAEVGRRHGVTMETVVADAADLSHFDDGTFDLVYGANVLHHVEIERCLREVHRVLVPGGRAAFWDPLHYNPAIQVYRRIATEVRTEDEHPLKRADLKRFEKIFDNTISQAFWLSGLLVFIKFFLVDRIHPNADRYWKLVVERQTELEKSLLRFHALDQNILKVFKPLRWWAWNIAVVVQKGT